MDTKSTSIPVERVGHSAPSASTAEAGFGAGFDPQQIRENVSAVGERVTQFIRERPGTSILIAIGAGYLIGRMLRA